MKHPPRHLPELALAAFVLRFAAPAPAALVPTEWQHRQAVEVSAPGLVRIPLPPATFDSAQPGLADLRILDPAGREVASFLDRGMAFAATAAPRTVQSRSFTSTPAGDATQLLVETGLTGPLAFLDLETSTPFFLKAAHVDISADGREWESLGPAWPLFRQFGAEMLRLPLGRSATFVRVTLDDYHTRAVVFTGARVRAIAGPVAEAPTTAVATTLAQREEFSGESVLTVALPGRNLPLAALELEVTDPLFVRRITVAVREAQGAVSSERVVASGTLYRVALEGTPVRAQLALPVDFSPGTRELLVHIHNGDSPPLQVRAVTARFHPAIVMVNAATAGRHGLLSGNPQAGPARYDLATLSGELRQASGSLVVPGPLEETPGYRPRESLASPPLPEIPLAGAALDARDWKVRRPAHLKHAGVQELELDPAALAGARPDFADLRLLRDDRQIPYLLEQPGLARSLELNAIAAPDSKRPHVSVWRVTLPQPGLPLARLVLASPTPLFSRQVRVYEKLTTREGRADENTLAAGAWSRTPEPGSPETKVFDLAGRVQGDTLWIETDDGDNPPIALGTVQAIHPVVRLVFKTDATDGYTLAYGNPPAAAPRYDLSLVAGKLLTAPRAAVRLDSAPAFAAPGFLDTLNSTAAFWAALVFVVAVLLGVVAKLLPKPTAEN